MDTVTEAAWWQGYALPWLKAEQATETLRTMLPTEGSVYAYWPQAHRAAW
jgi:hypothetical protein